MSVYGFRNKNTGEESFHRMSISEMEAYIAENPHFETFPNGAPLIHSGTGLGGGLKISNGFNDVLKKVKRESERGITRSTIETK